MASEGDAPLKDRQEIERLHIGLGMWKSLRRQSPTKALPIDADDTFVVAHGPAIVVVTASLPDRRNRPSRQIPCTVGQLSRQFLASNDMLVHAGELG